MRTEAEIDADILAAAVDIQNGAAALGEGYKKIIPALHEYISEAHRTGGEGSVEDILVYLGPERVRVDIVALLMAAGLGDVLVQAAGRKDHTPAPDFYSRVESVIGAGHLTASRGLPNADHLSAYEHPGVRIHGRASTGPVSPQGKAI